MENKLDKEFKDKWLTALRSGEYKQGQGCLYDSENDCYCCLGVAVALVSDGVAHDKGNWGYVDSTTEEWQQSGILDDYPQILQGWNKVTSILMDMNDEEGKSFLEIADYIEENL